MEEPSIKLSEVELHILNERMKESKKQKIVFLNLMKK